MFHHSPLAEFLLERSIGNTRVVGHAFFWALKACLAMPKAKYYSLGESAKAKKKEKKEKEKEDKRIAKRLGPYNYCQERFFLLLERFLMCCG